MSPWHLYRVHPFWSSWLLFVLSFQQQASTKQCIAYLFFRGTGIQNSTIRIKIKELSTEEEPYIKEIEMFPSHSPPVITTAVKSFSCSVSSFLCMFAGISSFHRHVFQSTFSFQGLQDLKSLFIFCAGNLFTYLPHQEGQFALYCQLSFCNFNCFEVIYSKCHLSYVFFFSFSSA